MNRLLTAFVGLGLFSFQAQAMVVETVTGETFAGYANTFIGTNTILSTDLGSADTSSNWSFDEGINGSRVTDTSAATSTLGSSSGAYIDLGFDSNLVNGTGADLKLFFVGGNGHIFDVTIGDITVSYNSLVAGASATGSFDPAFPTDPIIAVAIDLDSFTGLEGSSYSGIRLTIGDGYDPLAGSAVPSFVGTYNVEAAVVPVPAAAWLFGSGLLGLIGIARRRK